MKILMLVCAWFMTASFGVAQLPPVFSASIAGVGTNDTAKVPSVSIVHENEEVNVFFQGTLQFANAITGPWTDIPADLSPYQPSEIAQQQFYRARTPDSIFSSLGVATMRLIGPMLYYFELAFAGLPDGIFPPVRAKPYFDAVEDVVR